MVSLLRTFSCLTSGRLTDGQQMWDRSKAGVSVLAYFLFRCRALAPWSKTHEGQLFTEAKMARVKGCLQPGQSPALRATFPGFSPCPQASALWLWKLVRPGSQEAASEPPASLLSWGCYERTVSLISFS